MSIDAFITQLDKKNRAKTASFCSDTGDIPWIKQFQGTPLYARALELMEAEIDMKSQHLADRMRRRTESFHDKEWDQRDQMELQKKRLVLELHRMQIPPSPEETPQG